MRKTMTAIAFAVAMVAAMATTGWGQMLPPLDNTTVGIEYDVMLGAGIDGMVQGVAVTVDRPVWSYMTMAGVGSFVSGGGDHSNLLTSLRTQRMYIGVGPGVRLPVGETGSAEVFGHFLLGYIDQKVSYDGDRAAHSPEPMNGFSERIGGGIDMPVGESVRVRVGIDYDGEAHFVGGTVFEF